MMLKNNQLPLFVKEFSSQIILIFTVILVPPLYGADGGSNKDDKLQSVSISNATLSFKMIARTHAQMAGFYEGRGFSAKAINTLKDACFFTVIIKNKSRDILWLEPASWQINLVSGKKVQQLGRQFWRKRWQKLKIPKSSQSTFRWTLLPESRDLRPDEGVGGNLVLQATAEKINITPVFRIGAKGKSSLRLTTQTVRCGAR